MMRRLAFGFLPLLLIMLNAMPANAVDYALKCRKLYTTNCRQDVKMDAEMVKQCIHRGWDPPVSCRKNGGISAGVNVPGTSGVIYGTISAPEASAGRVGARPSVDPDTVLRTMGSQPWPKVGGQTNWCVLPGGYNICNLRVALKQDGKPKPPVATPVEGDVCPAKNDNTGFYGVKTLLNIGSPANMALECGGAIPISTYYLTLNKTPTDLATTEHGAFFLWHYTQGGANTAFGLKGQARRLPTVLCKQGVDPLGEPMVDAEGKPVLVKSVDLTAPIAQMITYNKQMKTLAIRLKSRQTIDSTIVPPPIPAYDDEAPEKYLVLPVVNGEPVIPSDPTNLQELATADPMMLSTYPLKGCALESEYYKTLEDSKTTADLTIESATVGACEGSPEQCGAVSITPTPANSCDTVNYTPKSTGTKCSNMTQYAILDRPNILFPPGSSTSLVPITGRSSVFVSTVDQTQLFMQASTIIHIGKTAPAFTLNEGAVVELNDGTQLSMFGPATVDGATGSLSLEGGGQHLTSGGMLIKAYYANGAPVVLRTDDTVLTMNANRSITLPAGYMVPSMSTQQSPLQQPYVQIPAVNR